MLANKRLRLSHQISETKKLTTSQQARLRLQLFLVSKEKKMSMILVKEEEAEAVEVAAVEEVAEEEAKELVVTDPKDKPVAEVVDNNN